MRRLGVFGCLRPSGINGSELNSSSFRNHSLVSSMIGSSSTPRPTRRMRTRSPSKRNSRGSRTAWLRPFWKSLAMSVLGISDPQILLNLSIYQKYILSNRARQLAYVGRIADKRFAPLFRLALVLGISRHSEIFIRHFLIVDFIVNCHFAL